MLTQKLVLGRRPDVYIPGQATYAYNTQILVPRSFNQTPLGCRPTTSTYSVSRFSLSQRCPQVGLIWAGWGEVGIVGSEIWLVGLRHTHVPNN